MRWMWIDRIVDYVPKTRLVAVKAVSAVEEQLERHFAGDGDVPALRIMPATLMIEGMAQSAGILAGAARGFREKVILAKIARASLDTDVLTGETIRYTATLDRIDDLGAASSGTVSLMTPPSTEWREIGRIDLMFSHVDRNLARVAFPEHNFVFDSNLDEILATYDHPDLVRPA